MDLDQFLHIWLRLQYTHHCNSHARYHAQLEGMGFDRALVLEVFFACNKNEQLAANYLLDHMHEFDNDDALCGGHHYKAAEPLASSASCEGFRAELGQLFWNLFCLFATPSLECGSRKLNSFTYDSVHCYNTARGTIK